jgi:hypothetical protein
MTVDVVSHWKALPDLVAKEAGADRGTISPIEPFGRDALGAPLAHPDYLTDQLPDPLRRRCRREVNLHRGSVGHAHTSVFYFAFWRLSCCGARFAPKPRQAGQAVYGSIQESTQEQISSQRCSWSCLRELIRSLAKILLRCHSTVRGLRNNLEAISGVDSPSRTSRAI